MRKKKQSLKITDEQLREFAHTKSFEEFEKEYGITELSFEAGQDGYPTSRYYEAETEKDIENRRKKVNKFLKKMSRKRLKKSTS